MAVLEVGAGPGLVTAEVAQALQPDGQLSAVDAQPSTVAQLGNRLRRRGVLNAMAQVADPHDLPFPTQAFDLVYLVAALGSIENRGRALREVRRVLKPNGRLAITEAITAPDYMLMAEVVGWAQTVGFELVERKGNAFLYTLVFRPMFGS
jgi:ubiquinone/menaquinone biosynthesis C-methylase UbiE